MTLYSSYIFIKDYFCGKKMFFSLSTMFTEISTSVPQRPLTESPSFGDIALVRVCTFCPEKNPGEGRGLLQNAVLQNSRSFALAFLVLTGAKSVSGVPRSNARARERPEKRRVRDPRGASCVKTYARASAPWNVRAEEISSPLPNTPAMHHSALSRKFRGPMGRDKSS